MKQSLTRKQVIIRFFAVTGMTRQNRHDFFCQGNFFEVLVGKVVARGLRPRAVFNLLNTVAGKKGSSHDLEFPNSQSPKDTANIYASYLRSHFSQQTPGLSRSAERSFINGPMFRLISPQHFLLPLHHQGTYNCCFQTFNFTASRPHL